MAQDDRLEGKTLKIAEKMLRDVTEIPEQNGVGYFLDAGTLPGSVRLKQGREQEMPSLRRRSPQVSLTQTDPVRLRCTI